MNSVSSAYFFRIFVLVPIKSSPTNFPDAEKEVNIVKLKTEAK